MPIVPCKRVILTLNLINIYYKFNYDLLHRFEITKGFNQLAHSILSFISHSFVTHHSLQVSS